MIKLKHLYSILSNRVINFPDLFKLSMAKFM